ncbi:MAG: type VI secretion system tip protein TssI/VgrG [Candidatus Eisenbacteria bacterium]
MAPDTRQAHLISPFGPEELLLQRMQATEELGRLSHVSLDLLSLDPQLKLDKVLGDKMTVVVDLPDGERFFNGHVARFGQAGTVGRYTRYKATLRPFLWLLTRTSDSRIFKKMTVPDIIKDVIGKAGVGEIEDKLQQTYLPREYVVQYRESTFNFLSRLMEEEGIYYYFMHEKEQHKLVLCDDKGSHKTVPGYEEIPFIDPEENASPREEHFSEWSMVQEVETGAYAVNDFDFEVPKADLMAKVNRQLPHKHAALEQYDPLAGYVDAMDAGNGGDTHRGDRAQHYARVRLEELQAPHDRSSSLGNARGVFSGALFTLAGHPREDQNRELLIVRAEYRVFQPGFDAGSSSGAENTKDGKNGKDGKDEPLFEVRLEVQPSKIPFRAARETPRPVIAGPHAALVVGSGEIWTDKFGRVKVHFPWDREDTEGCWVRVAQLWAGAGWGGLHVPRVGHEVIVEFIEGDPDRPIITGRVYNGANAPPFGLPDGASKSGILSRSSKGGGADNANEFRLEDKTGEEQVFLHAEKNMDTEVEKDQTLWVGQNRMKTVDKNQIEEVKGNKKIKVHGVHVEDIDKNMSLHVKGSEDETIDGSRSVTVGGNHTETIAGVQGVTVGGIGAWSVGGAGSIAFGGVGSFTVGGNLTVGVGGNHSTSVVGNSSNDVNGNFSIATAKKMSIDVSDDMSTSVKKKYTISIDDEHKVTVKKGYGLKAKAIVVEGEDEITFKCGSAEIILKKNGDISIKGKNVNVKADSDIVMKGSKISSN